MKMKKRMFVAVCIVMVATLSVFAAGPGEDVKAPEEFKVKFETSAGDFIVEVHREDAPNGVDRFYDAVKQGFYNECRFFRVVPDFVVQFGINGDPKEQKLWRDATIEDDKVKLGNERGVLCFASTMKPNSRTTQLFINLKDNDNLDSLGFAGFGKVVKGMEAVDKITSKYGQRPNQGLIQQHGNAYLKSDFPDMDYIKKTTILKD
tara:strand:- start:1084 stop:1698 length:615 start_codon:yes stop_codon:yes gene_type:complete